MKRILIVDDAMFIRYSLKILLEKNGFEVCGMAGNGQDGFEKYKELRPDIVTMNIVMPKVNGIEALKMIREFDPSAKVVMISASAREEIVRIAFMYGAKNFIAKPFEDQKVIQVLSEL